MKHQTFILVLVLFSFISCKNESTTTVTPIKVDVDQAQTIDLATKQWAKQPIKLDDSDDALIGLIDDVVAFDSVFLVRSRGKLMKFDYSGKFRGNISMQGQAGNEYIGLNSIWHRGDTLYLHDMNGKKVLVYDLNNTLLSTISLLQGTGVNPFQMLIPFNDHYIGKRVYNGTPDVVELAYYDAQCRYIQTIGDSLKLTSGITLGYAFSKYGNKVLYWRQLGNFIYDIDESLTLSERYYVDFGKRNVPLDNEALVDEYAILNFVKAGPPDRYALFLSGIEESDNYVIFCFLSEGKRYLSTYNKATQSTKVFYFTNDTRDIDVRPISEHQIMVFSFDDTDNGVVYTIDVRELLR